MDKRRTPEEALNLISQIVAIETGTVEGKLQRIREVLNEVTTDEEEALKVKLKKELHEREQHESGTDESDTV